MKKTGRPVSPHVTIYAFPMAAVSSITNRVTGVALSVGCGALGAVELVGGGGTAQSGESVVDFSACMCVIDCLRSTTLFCCCWLPPRNVVVSQRTLRIPG